MRVRYKAPLARRLSGVRSRTRRRDSGYAYLMALFLVFSIIIASQIAVRNLLTEGRREKETEMIWRGKQFERAIRIYYRKTGHYPQTIDDLEKGLPQLHFLRLAAYRDPMNTEDGAWRFIYVNGSGQIIGSVKYASLQQMAYLDTNGGQSSASTLAGATSASSLASQSNSSSNFTAYNSSFNPAGNAAPGGAQPAPIPGAPVDSSAPATGAANINAPPASGQDQGAAAAAAAAQQAQGAQAPAPQGSSNSTAPGGTPSNTPFGAPANQAPGAAPGGLAGLSGITANSPIAQQKPTGPVDGPVLGAFLTGVGSKIDRSSVKVYRGGKKYKDWEFIWNPLEDQARAVQQGLTGGGATSATPGTGLQGIGAGQGSSPGGPGAGSPFGSANPMGGPSPR